MKRPENLLRTSFSGALNRPVCGRIFDLPEVARAVTVRVQAPEKPRPPGAEETA